MQQRLIVTSLRLQYDLCMKYSKITHILCHGIHQQHHVTKVDVSFASVILLISPHTPTNPKINTKLQTCRGFWRPLGSKSAAWGDVVYPQITLLTKCLFSHFRPNLLWVCTKIAPTDAVWMWRALRHREVWRS